MKKYNRSRYMTATDQIQQAYDHAGSWRNLKGLQAKLQALEALQRLYPDNDLVDDYLIEVSEALGEFKIEQTE